METSTKREKRATLKAQAAAAVSKPAVRKAHKTDNSAKNPVLVVGKEVVGRELEVWKDGHPEWVPGSVKDFDEPQVLHQIVYKTPLPKPAKDAERIDGEEWLCLSKHPFQWTAKHKNWPYANPTYSNRFTPQKEQAIGQRVRVFWPKMSRWYQGKVVSYDDASGMHRVKFHDGDIQGYTLSQEALVWLDIPELSSDSAIKKMRSEEGGLMPVAIVGNDENKPPAKLEPTASISGTVSERGKTRKEKKEQLSSMRKVTRRQSAQMAEKEATAKKLSPRSPSKQAPSSEAQKSPLKEQAKGPKSPSKSPSSKAPPQSNTAAAVGTSTRKGTGPSSKKQSSTPVISKMAGPQESKEQVPSQVAEKEKPSQSAGMAAPAVEPLPPALAQPAYKMAPPQISQSFSSKPSGSCAVSKSADNGVTVKVVHADANLVGLQSLMRSPAPSNPRKRSRAAAVSLATKPSGPDDPPAAKYSAVSKLSRGQPKIGQKPKPPQKSRQGSRLGRNSSDMQFVENCEAIKGSRVGIWWASDNCYYKGQVKGYDACQQTLIIAYDDGYTMRTKKVESLQLRWLVPRGRTGGATDRLHAAFQSLGAVNAQDPVRHPEERQSVAVEIPVKLEERAADSGLHPSRPSPDARSQPSPQPVAQISPATANSARPEQLIAPGSNANHFLPGSRPGAQLGPMVPVVSTSAPGAVAPAGLPVMLMTLPQSNMVVQYTNLPIPQQMQQGPPSLQASMPALAGQIQGQSYLPVRPSSGAGSTAVTADPSPSPSPLLRSPANAPTASFRRPLQDVTQSPGFRPPSGSAAEGWKVSIVFRGDGQVYEGRVLAFQPKTKMHRILWEDGEDEWIDVSEEDLNWLCDCKKIPGYAAGLPKGTSTPTGQDLVGWKVALYWTLEGEFYQGTIESCDEAINQHRILYVDGEERYETMSDVIFKYVLPPSVEAVGPYNKAWSRQSDDWEAAGRQNFRRPRRKQTYSPSDDSDEEPVVTAPLLGQRSLASLRTIPSLDLRSCGTQSIKRLASGRGSLLMFGDQVPVSPICSPLSPQGSMGFGSMRMDSRLPACVKNVSGLRDAAGFRVGVKRVRVFLNDPLLSARGSKDSLRLPETKSLPRIPTDPKLTEVRKSEADSKQTAPATEDDEELSSLSLKTILDRVEQAKENIRNGMPLEVRDSPRGQLTTISSSLQPTLQPTPSSLPGPFLPRVVSQATMHSLHEPQPAAIKPEPAAPADPVSSAPQENGSKKADQPGLPSATAAQKQEQPTPKADTVQNILSAPPIPENPTPPPSPFSGVRTKQCGPVQTSSHCVSEALLTSCAQEHQLSVSLPQTPPITFEAVLRAPSRSTSIASHGQHSLAAREGLPSECRPPLDPKDNPDMVASH